MAQLSGIDGRAKNCRSRCPRAAVSVLPVLGHIVELLAKRRILWQIVQIEILGFAPLVQRQIAGAEQVHHHIQRLLSVVEAFQELRASHLEGS